MHHLLLSIFLLAMLCVCLRLAGLRSAAIWLLSFLPLVLLFAAMTVERLAGIEFYSHALFHFAYDTSYILTVSGLVLILHHVIRKRRVTTIVIALLIASIPLIQIVV